MNRHAVIATTFTVLSVGAFSVNPAFADNHGSKQDKAEMQAMQSAKISLVDAVQAAQKKSGGKAVEAAFANENGKSGYEISLVAADGSEKTVHVDATSGAVTKMTATNEGETNEHCPAARLADTEQDSRAAGAVADRVLDQVYVHLRQ